MIHRNRAHGSFARGPQVITSRAPATPSRTVRSAALSMLIWLALSQHDSRATPSAALLRLCTIVLCTRLGSLRKTFRTPRSAVPLREERPAHQHHLSTYQPLWLPGGRLLPQQAGASPHGTSLSQSFASHFRMVGAGICCLTGARFAKPSSACRWIARSRSWHLSDSVHRGTRHMPLPWQHGAVHDPRRHDHLRTVNFEKSGEL